MGGLDAGTATETLNMKHKDITHAEAGKYIVSYHVQDKAGNKECKTLKRTILVKDTLPPVIQLKLGNKIIHRGDSSQKGLNGVQRPSAAGSSWPRPPPSTAGWSPPSPPPSPA